MTEDCLGEWMRANKYIKDIGAAKAVKADGRDGGRRQLEAFTRRMIAVSIHARF